MYIRAWEGPDWQPLLREMATVYGVPVHGSRESPRTALLPHICESWGLTLTEIKTQDERSIDEPTVKGDGAWPTEEPTTKGDGAWPTEEPHTSKDGSDGATTKGDGAWPTEEPTTKGDGAWPTEKPHTSKDGD
jgi:hypothetical protein